MDGEAAWWPATRPDKTLVNVRDLGKPTDFLSEAMEPWAAGVYSKQSMVDKWHWLGIVKATMTQDPKDPTKQIKVFIEDEARPEELAAPAHARDKQPPVRASASRRRHKPIGGGPAGSATALTLARAGRTVAVVERTRYDNVRIGETLPPRASPLLATLGLPTQLQHDGHVSAPGIVTAWGNAEPRCNDFIVNPYGNGWHLDRPRFDHMLAAHAREWSRGV